MFIQFSKKFTVLAFLTVLVQGQGAMGQPWRDCQAVFSEGFKAQQNLAISAFQEGHYDPKDLKLLSGVTYQLKVAKGSVVLRFDNDSNDIGFEIFAHNTFEKMDLIAGQIVKEKVPRNIRDEMIARLQKKQDENSKDLLHLLGAHEDLPMTVVGFIEGSFLSGDIYLNRQKKMHNYRENDDRRELFWSYVSPQVQSQLADMWAGHVVLGISDPHPFNWMINSEGFVASIDLAMRTTIFERGIPKIQWLTLTSPLGPGNFSAAHLAELRSGLSLEMRQKLQSLEENTIKSYARLSNFTISDVQIKGMIERARNLLQDP